MEHNSCIEQSGAGRVTPEVYSPSHFEGTAMTYCDSALRIVNNNGSKEGVFFLRKRKTARSLREENQNGSKTVVARAER